MPQQAAIHSYFEVTGEDKPEVVGFPKPRGYSMWWPESYLICLVPVHSQPIPPEDTLFIVPFVC